MNETGTPRLVSIDFIRGIAIFMNLVCHSVEGVISDRLLTGEIPISTLETIILMPILVLSLIFASMRSLFVYVSGFSFGLTYVKRLLKLDFKKGLIETLKIYVMSFLVMPLLLCFSFLERYMTNMYSYYYRFPVKDTHWY